MHVVRETTTNIRKHSKFPAIFVENFLQNIILSIKNKPEILGFRHPHISSVTHRKSSNMTSSLTDKEYMQLTISISKAFNSFEAPVKSKHVRAAIIGTYHSNGGHAFWAIAIRQP